MSTPGVPESAEGMWCFKCKARSSDPNRCLTCGADPVERIGKGIFSDLLGAYDDIGKERDWFAEGAIEASPLVVLAAGEKVGKSWMLIDLAVSTVTGTKWLGGLPIKKPGQSWYLDCEYGEHEFTRRATRIIRGKGFNPRDVLPQIRHVWAVDFRLTHENDLAKRLFEIANSLQPSVICIDPWRNVLPGEENNAKDTIDAMYFAGKFRDHAFCPVIIAHHLNRMGSMSGSRAMMGRADLLIEGTDEECPWFSARGRTLRRSDAFASKFTVNITHDDDDDDTIATTRLSMRFEGDKVAKAELRKPALRVLDVIRRNGGKSSCKAIREALGMNNTAAKSALDDLEKAGMVELRNGSWSSTARGTFEGAFEDAEKARAEGRAPPIEIQPETFARPQSQRRRRR